jgi:hypothetical protein
MTKVTSDDLDRFYSLLGQLAAAKAQGRPLRELPKRAFLPQRGVYFFMEPGEGRAKDPSAQRVVRVGTHGLKTGAKSTLYGRLRQHMGTRTGGGNHRGSIFRLHVGAALLARDGAALPTWGGSSMPPAVRESDVARAAEVACEKCVSTYIGAMPVFWIDVPDEPGPMSQRDVIERNAIALLSNQFSPIDGASKGWLGRSSPCQEIRDSGLWNVDYVERACDSAFLDALESFVMLTIATP